MKKSIIAIILVLAVIVSCVAVFAGCSNKKLVGFDTELAEAVASELGLKVKFVEIDWDSKETMLESGAIDVVWNGFTYTEARDNGYIDPDRDNKQIGGLDFTEFYMENKQVAVVKKANAAFYASNASFAGKKGCAEASSAGQSVIEDVLGVECSQLGKQLDVFTAVTAGTYDFGVIDLTMASEYISSAKGAYKDSLAIVSLEDVEVEYYAVAVKEKSNLRDALNYALKKCFDNGTAKNLAEKYSLDSNLYNGFTKDYTLPTDGATAAIQKKGKITIGYTIFAPMNYFEGEEE
ncbi:MAG: transporter substrate-binding domain-containing protein [Clostridia bacterium]|nr:transporter substrate-binding domain-containing protein [Clostridia bacterium]